MKIWKVSVAACLCSGALSAQTALLKVHGTTPGEAQGWQGKSLGDVNGDGAPDFAIASPHDDSLGPMTGRVEVRSGRTGAVLHTFLGDAAGDGFGRSVDAAGDVDGDGVGDVVVGADQYVDFHVTGPGYARVFSGSTGAVLHTIVGPGPDSYFGVTVSGAGDVDADGHADVLVTGAWENGVLEPFVGAVHLYSGATGAEMFTVRGVAFHDYVGVNTCGVGDVNQDGHDDFLIGAFGGDANGASPGTATVYSGLDFSSLYSLAGAVTEEGFGFGVSGGGDVNADGVPDFAVGSPALDDDLLPGKVFVYSGSDGSVLWTGSGTPGDRFGSGLSIESDVDGDGYADVAVGALFAEAGGTDRGTLQVYSGQSGALLLAVSGSGDGDALGFDVQAAGDLNGDGLDEVFASVPFSDAGAVDGGSLLAFTLRDCPASAQDYGSGWPGTLGIPSLGATPPELGTTFTVSAGNSRGVPTPALLLIAFAKASVPTTADGTLLVAPPWFPLVFVVPAAGLNLAAGVPSDVLFCGLEIDLQMLQSDPGASRNLSFSPGLELLLGG